jgi:squalene-hopene/tetraprenyl-beta-curcumene cyclase
MEKTMNRVWLAGALALAVVMASGPREALAQKKKSEPKTAEKMIADAVAFLKARQEKGGTWSKANNVGLTGIVLTGLLRGGKVPADDAVAAEALKFIETMIDEKEGSIARGEKVFQANYVTCVNLTALKASGQGKYKAVIDRAVTFLKGIQNTEANDKKRDDLDYGGMGYRGGTRSDLSNTHFFLDALITAGVPKTDEAFKKAAVFVSRCQNVKSEHNTQPWAARTDDGSFIYVLAQGKGGAAPTDAARPGYGSMTYVGLKALADCGVAKDDVRFKKALAWVSKNYSVDLNPGMPPGGGHRGYYYYLLMMATALESLGIDEITTPDGKKHDWRAEITDALRERQRRDGSWANDAERWMETNPDLCTAYALLTLSHCKKGK